MALPSELIDELAMALGRHSGTKVTISGALPVGGGSINDCYRLDTTKGRFFVKVNTADRFPSLFEAEADGLQRLMAAGPLAVPRVIAHGERAGHAFLLMEWLGSGLKGRAFWEDFGCGLAQLHRHTQQRFGLARDNYIGSLPQINTEEGPWDRFFILHRLEPLLRRARDRGHLGDGAAFRFERLFGKLGGLFPHEPPALLHGDLWSGNFICGTAGEPILIDPAVYYGHREMDLAMTRLFRGFDEAFYDAYQSQHALAIGWQERTDICNLYPLLVHVNLFGGGYAQQVDSIVRRYC